jgi:hypothetical protein
MLSFLVPRLLVPRLCLGMHIQRLCLFLAKISEAEPLELGSQAEPRNQLNVLPDLREGET